MIVYISGPMTGYKNYNRDAFNLAERQIRHEFKSLLYLKIVNPVKIGDRVNESFNELNKTLSIVPGHEKLIPQWNDYLRMCLAYLVSCTRLLFLEGVSNERGCNA
jgi:hypothetical protein